MAQSENSGRVAFISTKAQFDRFLKIIQKADTKSGPESAMVVIASMLTAILGWLCAAVGVDEAKKAYDRFGEDFFKNLKKKIN